MTQPTTVMGSASTARRAARRAPAAGRSCLIRRAREAKGLTQRELGELLGLSQSVVCRLESGRLAPAPDLLPRIAAVLDLPGDALCAVLAGADGQQWRRWIWASQRAPNEKLLLLALLDQPGARGALDALTSRTGLGSGTVRSLAESLLRDGLLRREADHATRRTLLALAGRPGEPAG